MVAQGSRTLSLGLPGCGNRISYDGLPRRVREQKSHGKESLHVVSWIIRTFGHDCRVGGRFRGSVGTLLDQAAQLRTTSAAEDIPRRRRDFIASDGISNRHSRIIFALVLAKWGREFNLSHICYNYYKHIPTAPKECSYSQGAHPVYICPK